MHILAFILTLDDEEDEEERRCIWEDDGDLDTDGLDDDLEDWDGDSYGDSDSGDW